MPIDESKYKQLKLDRPSNKVLRITFDKPDTYNSLDEVGHRELAYIWRDIDDDPSINSVILTGAGKAFSSGGDFSMIEKVIDDFDYRANTWKEARDLVYNVINCSKPIISAIIKTIAHKLNKTMIILAKVFTIINLWPFFY